MVTSTAPGGAGYFTAPSLRVATSPGAVDFGYLWNFLGLKKGQPFKPFPAQFELLDTVKIPWPGYGPSIYGINCGRRFSKTTSAEIKVWEAALAPDDMFGPPCVRITADTFEHGLKIWDRFIWHAENTDLKVLIKSHDRSRFLVTFITGATVQLLSANNPQALAGDGVTAWFIDEAQYLSYAAWENLFPSTAERDGVIVMLGVAEGEGPFREVCYKGDNPKDNPEFLRLCYPTSANPFVPRWRIALAQKMYTPGRFKQLYLAQWDNEIGKVFRNVRGCVVPGKPRAHPKGWGEVVAPRPGHEYFGGLDLALYTDWCVYTIGDRHGNLVAWDRFNRGSWELLKNRVFELSKHYNHPPTWVDSTGSGDPIYEDLVRRGMNAQGYKISSNEKKRALVDELAIRIGAGNWKYPEIRTMIQELEVFEATRTNSGVIQYGAPAGSHDDFVIALSLQAWGTPRPIAESLVAQIADDPYSYMEDDDELRELMASGMLIESDTARQYSEADYI